MKSQTTMRVIVTTLVLILSTQYTFSQWQLTSPNGNDPVGSNTATVTGVGIGNFATTSIASALHINTNLLATQTGSPSWTLGEVFRTDCPSGNSTYWRMLRGGNEYGRIWNDNNNNFEIGVVNTSGDLRFNTHGNTLRMIILQGGKVGIGTPSNAAKRLEVRDNASQLELSYDATYNADLFCTSTGNLDFIPNGGTPRVGILQASPSNTLDVNGGVHIQSMPTNTSSTQFVVATGSNDLEQRSLANLNLVSTCNTSSQYYVPRYCSTSNTQESSQYWDDGTYVGVAAGEASQQQGCLMNVIPQSSGSGQNGMYIKSNYTGSVLSSLGLVVADNGGVATCGQTNIALLADCSGLASYPSGCSPYPTNYGILSKSNFSNANAINVGVAGASTGGVQNTGVNGSAYGGTTNYGVIGFCNGNTGASDWAVYANGNAGGSSAWQPSDAILKTNISEIADATSIISQLQPHTYYFDTTTFSFMGLPSSLQYGFVAEEVQPVCPNLVKVFNYPQLTDGSGNVIHEAFKIDYMNYTGYIPLIVEALKEQQTTIDALQAQLDGCCGGGMRTNNPNNDQSQTVELATSNQIQLGNAAPNPNSGQTTIPFHLPQSVVKAEMVFTDLLGQEVNRVELGARGFSQINVTTSQLEDGTYNYTLIADGKVIDTKQLVKSH